MKKILIALFMVVSILSGCKKDTKEPSAFLNTEWNLSYIQNISTKLTFNFPADADRRISLVFTDAGVVVFTGVCNDGTGNFTYVPVDTYRSTLTVTDLSSTKVSCTHVDWEENTLESLGKAYKYEITGNSMTITTTGNFNLFFTAA